MNLAQIPSPYRRELGWGGNWKLCRVHCNAPLIFKIPKSDILRTWLKSPLQGGGLGRGLIFDWFQWVIKVTFGVVWKCKLPTSKCHSELDSESINVSRQAPFGIDPESSSGWQIKIYFQPNYSLKYSKFADIFVTKTGHSGHLCSTNFRPHKIAKIYWKLALLPTILIYLFRPNVLLKSTIMVKKNRLRQNV